MIDIYEAEMSIVNKFCDDLIKSIEKNITLENCYIEWAVNDIKSYIYDRPFDDVTISVFKWILKMENYVRYSTDIYGASMFNIAVTIGEEILEKIESTYYKRR